MSSPFGPAPLAAADLAEPYRLALTELAAQGRSPRTRASYEVSQRYWQVWHQEVLGAPLSLPVAPPVVLVFLAQHAQTLRGGELVHAMPAPLDAALVAAGVKRRPGPLALATILHRIAVLSAAHGERNVPNPCSDARVRRVLRDLRSAYGRRGARPHKKDPVRAEQLLAMLGTCEASLRGVRDRALLWFIWSTGGQRRSDAAGAHMDHLHPTPLGDYSYELTAGKTNPQGQLRPENHKPIVADAAQALRDWLQLAQIDSGFIFRSIVGRSRLGASLSPDAVNDIVHKRCAQAGLSGDLSAHSLRSGFVTQAMAAGAGLSEVMALTGLRDLRSLVGYSRVDQADMRRTALELVVRARL